LKADLSGFFKQNSGKDQIIKKSRSTVRQINCPTAPGKEKKNEKTGW